MRTRNVCLIIALLAIAITGCPQSSDGIDLSDKGSLTMTITRASESSLATVTAQVTEQGLLTNAKVTLADDQILTIDATTLAPTARTTLGLDAAYSATVEAADAPGSYTLNFDNQGVTTNAMVAPPPDFSNVSPRAATTISGQGFEFTWDSPQSSGVTVEITIAGFALQANTETGAIETVPHTVTLPPIVDDGGIVIGANELAFFQPGQIIVTLTRSETTSPQLGFAAGEIRVEIVREIALILQ